LQRGARPSSTTPIWSSSTGSFSTICSEDLADFCILLGGVRQFWTLSGSAAEFSNLASSGINGFLDLTAFWINGFLDLTAFWIIGFVDLTAFWILRLSEFDFIWI
jgi:hypothetical protein